MAGLPKIALARLKAQPHAPKPSGPSGGRADFQGGQHPDANLLAALVEKTLTERERTQVLDHLSQCAECREVAAFTLLTETPVAPPTRVPAGRRWSPWLILRWSAMAVVLGAVTVVVVLHPGMWNRPAEVSQQTAPPVPAGNITSAPPTLSAPPSSPPSPEPVKTKAQKETQEPAGEMAAKGSASGSRQDLALNNQAARVKARQQLTLKALPRPPATLRSQFAPSAKAEQEESRGGSGLTAGALPAPAPSAAPAAVRAAASEDAMRATAESQAAPALGATTQSVAVAGANAGAGLAAAGAAKVAARAPRPATVRMSAQAPMSEVQAFRKKIELGTGPPASLWSLSTDGKVQRSTDGGKTFEPIPVANGVRFRAIAVLGNEVWTGGAGGALFHSADGGATWKQTDLNDGGTAVTETITGIQMPDPQHLTVTTASGAQWVSEDGGQHWRRQP